MTFQPWIRYIEHKADSPKNILNMIFERALKELPGSYKLWYNYLKVISTPFNGNDSCQWQIMIVGFINCKS